MRGNWPLCSPVASRGPPPQPTATSLADIALPHSVRVIGMIHPNSTSPLTTASPLPLSCFQHVGVPILPEASFSSLSPPAAFSARVPFVQSPPPALPLSHNSADGKGFQAVGQGMHKPFAWEGGSWVLDLFPVFNSPAPEQGSRLADSMTQVYT